MNQTEKRRQKLLEYTRNLYTDKRYVPAVHPRYKAVYQQMYSEDMNVSRSTLGLRSGVSIILFITFILMKYNGAEILGIDNLQVFETIMHNYQMKLY